MFPKMKTVISTRGYPIPIEMRPIWRISLIALSISAVGGEKKYLDLKKLNILVWMLIRKQRWGEYEEFLFDRSEKIPIVSVDTANYTAVEMGIAIRVFELNDKRLHIEQLGDELIELISKNQLLIEERSFLERVGKKLTDKKVRIIMGGK